MSASDVYELGTAVALDYTFRTDADNDGQVDDNTDPTGVTFLVQKPDGTVLTYTTPAAEIANPATGQYVLSLDAATLDQPGAYPYTITGTGAVEAAAEDFFIISGNALLTPSTAPQTQGVCGTWVDADALVSACSEATWDTLQPYAYAASEILYYASGRRYAAGCSVIVRPCDDRCGCGNQLLSRGHIIVPPWALDQDACSCLAASCCEVSEIWLAGYPVRRVTQVMIDGVVLPDDGTEWRLDQSRRLVRLADADGNPRSWPGCQNRGLPDDAVGAFTIAYEYGADPPYAGKLAALALAQQLWNACPDSTGDCQLPAGVTRVTRQGVTMDAELAAELLVEGKTGIVPIDSFIAVFGNAAMPVAGAAVWSPDVPGFAQPVG